MEIAIGLLTSGFQALTGTAATSTAAATAGAAATSGAAAAGSGFSLASLLEGTATVLGAVSAIGAGYADAEMMELQAEDAERQIPLETLQGISRRASIKRELAEAIGDQDTAYAASGVDLSFGTPRVAKKQAFREADYALTSDAGTQETRTARLSERASVFRGRARRARRGGFMDALGLAFSYGADRLERG
ncbi:hypothetical protein H1W37_19485 [Stappia taiwanensis]|uniref:Uncharacterized protein n=1 Tax=Stappia taiwanensis TaxID=992267 RepID=A0A838XZI2_9HYPH|nr:hypothetical protein [Stappia taiwanensis]MBA4613846.1 hypothetical protein [Stappia taiwanensis]GGE79084.1 hypothetical protein GCM10007285_03620 [Stappia taiwanensis]